MIEYFLRVSGLLCSSNVFPIATMQPGTVWYYLISEFRRCDENLCFWELTRFLKFIFRVNAFQSYSPFACVLFDSLKISQEKLSKLVATAVSAFQKGSGWFGKLLLLILL